MQDYPDFAYGVMPGPTSDIAPGYGVLWNYYNTAAVAAGSTWTININPVDDDYLYKIDGIFICTSSNVNVSALVVLDDRPIYRGYAKYGLTFHTYNNPMIEIGYNDKLKIEIKNEDTSSRYLYIAIYGVKRHLPGGVTRVPVPNFSGTPLSGSAPLTVQFTDASYRFPTSWDWDFGDGSARSSAQHPSHQYTAAGSYKVKLVVSNSAGFDMLERSNYITVTSIENLTTYTQVDPFDYIATTTTRCTVSNMTRNVAAYCYCDKGADFFNALGIKFTICLTGYTGTNPAYVPFALANVVGPRSAFGTTDMYVMFYRTSSVEYRLRLIRGIYGDEDYYVMTMNTIYYCTLERAAGADTVYLKIYSNPERTSLLDTLSVSGFGTTKWRYIYAANSLDTTASGTFSGYTENIMV